MSTPHLLLITHPVDDYIDFSRSSFYVHGTGKGKIRDIEIKNKSDFYATRKSPKTPQSLGIGETLKPEHISIRKSMDYDLFRFDRLGGFFLNEKLKQAIESAGITDVSFEEAPYLVLE